MARALGVVCKAREIYLAIADDGQLVDGLPERIQTPALYDHNEGLLETIEEIRRELLTISPDIVWILRPWPHVEEVHSRHAPKAALETLVRVVCAQEKIDVESIYPATVRSQFEIPRGGDLEDALPPVGKYWKRKRCHAAAAALAAERKT